VAVVILHVNKGSSQRSICFLKANTIWFVRDGMKYVYPSNIVCLIHVCALIHSRKYFHIPVSKEMLHLSCCSLASYSVGFNPKEIHVTYAVKEIVLGDNFSPGTLGFCDHKSLSEASTPTVRIILRNRCSCVKHLVPLVSPF